MRIFEIFLILTIWTFIVHGIGFLVGANTYEQLLKEEIEQYNSFRIDGVYYYPEEDKQ